MEDKFIKADIVVEEKKVDEKTKKEKVLVLPEIYYS